MYYFIIHQDDNEKLKQMDAQLIETDKDYDVIQREKVEARKQLEAKF